MATVCASSAQPEPLNAAARCHPAGNAPAASQPASGGALTATGTIGVVPSGTSAIGSGIVMVPLVWQAGLGQLRSFTRSLVAIKPTIVVNAAIYRRHGDAVLNAGFFITIGAVIGRCLLLSPARLRLIFFILVLVVADLLLVELGCGWWIPLPPQEVLGNATFDILAAVSGLFAVLFSAVTVHQVVRAAVDTAHLARGA